MPGTDLADLNTYYANVQQTNSVPITLLSTDGTSTSCVNAKGRNKCDDTEQTLDMTQALGMAPGLASLVVYVGSTDTAIISSLTTHSPLQTTVGCSWGWSAGGSDHAEPVLREDGGAGSKLFHGVGRLLHLDGFGKRGGLAGGQCLRHLSGRHGSGHGVRRRSLGWGNGVDG